MSEVLGRVEPTASPRQRRITEEVMATGLLGIPPSWAGLWRRLFGLVVEWAVELRRVLIWLAPFIGLGYIIFDVIRG